MSLQEINERHRQRVTQQLHLQQEVFVCGEGNQQPVMMLVGKERVGSKVHKKYDRAQTPCQRALASDKVSPPVKLHLQQTFLELNPVSLKTRIDESLKKLWCLSR